MKEVYQEAALVDLDDDALINLIGALWEAVKTTDEQMNADEHIQRVTDELKAYKKEHYLDVKKAYQARLKAARYLAKARDLKFKLDGLSDD